MRKDFYETLKEAVQSHFVDYLKSCGLKVNGRSFQCPNHSAHQHDDENPSCQLFADGLGGKCFRCDKYWDIFEAYKFIEGEKPFIEILKDLGKRFAGYTDEDYINASEENKKSAASISETTKMYYVLYKLAGFLHERGIHIIEERKWNDEKLNLFYDAVLLPSSFDFCSFVEGILSNDDVKLVKKYFGENLFHAIFQSGNIVFIIRDRDGHPVGFSARRHEGKPKYLHNHNFDNIFRKSECLYGYTQLENYDKNKPLFVVEGYADVVSLAYIGYPAVAVMGTSIAKEQMNMIIDSGFSNIIIAFDNDDAGYKGDIKAIEQLYPLTAEHNYYLYLFPWSKIKGDIKDIDELISNHIVNNGDIEKKIKKFEKTALSYSIYDYYIDYYQVKNKKGDGYTDLLNFISKYDNLVEHIRWSRKISEIIEVSSDIIVEEIHRRQSIKKANRDKRMGEIVDRLSKNIYKYRHNGDVIYDALHSAYEEASDIMDEYIGGLTSNVTGDIEAFSNYLSFIKSTSADNYVKIDWERFSRLQFYGISREPVFTLIGGGTHSGKSSILRNIAYQILKNDNKDVVVIFHSNDDDKYRVFQAMLSIISGVPIFSIRSYKRLLSSRSKYALEAKERLKKAESILMDMLGGRLIITDVNDGNSIKFLANEVEKVMNLNFYPILFIDSLHKLEESSSYYNNENERIGNLAINLKKKVLLRYRIPVFTTSERRKAPTSTKKDFITVEDVAGSRKLGYEPDIIILLKNEHARLLTDESDYVIEETDPFILSSGIKRFLGSKHIYNPYIEARVTKNKFSGYGGRIYYVLQSATTRMRELTKDEEKDIGLVETKIEKEEEIGEMPDEWNN